MTGPLRVMQVITGLGPGGAERLLLDLAARLDPRRIDLRLVSIKDDLRALRAFGHEGIPVEVLDLSGARALRGMLALRDLMRGFAPQVVHAHMFHGLVAATLAARALPRPPRLCFTSHNAFHPRARALAIRALRPWRAADVVFAPGQHAPLNARRTAVIPNGVPVADAPPPRRPWSPAAPVRLLALGRLVPQKDPLGLLDAVARVATDRIHLRFAGDGPLRAEAEARAALGLRPEFLGHREDVRALLRDSDLLVMHSLHEGMPMALLEAGAEATPALATPVGAIPGMLAYGRGFLAPRDAFADRLAQVLADPGGALAAGRRLHAHVLAHHGIEATVERHAALYESLVAERP